MRLLALRKGTVLGQVCALGFLSIPRAATIHRSLYIMMKLASKLRSFLAEEDGPTAVEYAVMLALIVMVCVAAVAQLGTTTAAQFTPVANVLAPTP